MAKSKDDFIPLADDEQLLQSAIPIDELEEAEPLEDERGPGSATSAAEIDAIDLVDDDEEEAGSKEIRTFGKDRRADDDDRWQREPDPRGAGGTRCKTFVAKLRLDAIEFMDEQINKWLDSHPNFTVKNITASIGILKGKEKEDALFLTLFI